MGILQLAVFGGIVIGVVYALAGASMVVIYRTSGYISFAQGDIAAISLYVALWVHNQGAPYPIVAITTIVVGALAGALVGGLIVVPIERFGLVHAALATIALGLVIQGVENVIVGGEPRAFPSSGEGIVLKAGAISVSRADIIALVSSGVIFALLGLMFTRSQLGVAMRAVSDSPQAAEILGIRASRLRRVSWLIGGALAGAAGLFVAPTFALTPYSLDVFLIFAFCAVVVGGFESIFGALVAGVAVGVASNLVVAYIGPNMVNLGVYLMLLLVLLIRPHGIFGRRPIARV